jgi:hypothetical protein
LIQTINQWMNWWNGIGTRVSYFWPGANKDVTDRGSIQSIDCLTWHSTIVFVPGWFPGRTGMKSTGNVKWRR